MKKKTYKTRIIKTKTKTRKTKTTIKSMNLGKTKTIKSMNPRKGGAKKRKFNNESFFLPTEGEDGLEASISFLTGLMGSSLFETYVDDYLNPQLNKNTQIKVIPVSRPLDPENKMVLGQPAIFYGNAQATHFSVTLDGKYLWNSYKGIQKTPTDHFCQTFALMYAQHFFLPNSFVAIKYNELEFGEYMHNAIIAKNVCCDILHLLNQNFEVGESVNDTLNMKERNGSFTHKQNPSRPFILEEFLNECRLLTLEDFCKSTIKTRIM